MKEKESLGDKKKGEQDCVCQLKAYHRKGRQLGEWKEIKCEDGVEGGAVG